MRGLTCGVLVALLAAGGAEGAAQETVQVVAGADYAAGGLYRFFFGDHYRNLWTRPVEAERLDLEREAGGLRAIEKGGGQQTRSLRFQAADGREFAFRSVQKDPSVLVPEELRGTVAHDIVQDQISSSHPAGALVVSPLLEAAGVPHARPRLVVLPDDPRLGEFRAEFAGMLGLFEERPGTDESGEIVPGAVKVISSDALFRRVEESTDDRVDARALLAARLMDGFLGDWDRHRDQWRWATFEQEPPRIWRPIPRDRDQAFVRFDGLLLAVARARGAPQLVNFGPSYPGAVGLTWNGRELDRRFLVGLERAVWDSAAAALQARLTDEVIAAAVARLPAAYAPLDSARLLAGLRARRDALPRFAADFYRLLATEVDIHATDERDQLAVVATGEGRLRVTVAHRGGTPYFDRTFLADETGELRVYLHGGGDSTVLTPGGTAGIRLRVIGGGGADVFTAAPGGEIRGYDVDTTTRIVGDVALDRKPYSTGPKPSPTALPPRDWGSGQRKLLWLGGGPDVGLFLGAGIEWTDFGFRQQPYASRHMLRAGYATGASTGKVEYGGEFLSENSSTRLILETRASGIEVLRFHGFGNEASITDDDEFYRVKQLALAFEPALGFGLGPKTVLLLGPSLRYTNTEDGSRFIDQFDPYGADNFGMVGARLGLRHDSRDVAGYPTRGAVVDAEVATFPEVWDVQSTFATAQVSLATYLQLGSGSAPVLALRAGGKQVFGDAPYQEAAYIGDPGTVRLGLQNRYGGDASLFGGAEFRLPIGGYRLFLPGKWGILALGDVGRVFLDGESSSDWHAAYGGGLWFSPVSRANTISITFANSEERGKFYVQAGFGL